MGNSEADPPVKASKSSAAQEQPSVTSISPATPVYPDWSTFQAYSPIPSPGFFHSTVASTPSPHPYVWGAHPLLPPYGTPPPYVLYPPGGIYGHPSMTFGSHPFSPYAMVSPNGNRETSGAVPANREAESKPSEGKEKSSIKRSEGSLGSLNIIVGKNSEFGKTSGASVNEAYSQSGDSGSEDSSEGSDANSQNDSPPKASDHQNSSDAGTPQNGNPARTSTGHGSQNEITRAPSQPVLGHTMPIIHVPVPAVSGAVATSPSPIVPICDKTPSTEVPRTVVPGAPSKLWMQDERELKRQRRMESNRESAKRSRLRKQAECEELAHRVEVLEEENASLRAELNHMKKKYEQLTQNTSLKESLGEITEGTEELIPDENQKSSADDDLQKNIDSDGKGREAD